MPFLLLMPSYNQAHYIADVVRSVLAQDDPDWELWIVDNSTDSTSDTMRQFQDARIRFHHIPERMDPGTCLNWMLAHATGEMFSYIHTDNNLHKSYVRRMRAALANNPLGLCYCDMHTIDERGHYLNVFKRGEFDLARLMSINPLGVPFAATTELARQVGGFGVRDFADDVRFCVSAYGLAHYVYLRDALIDYRLHSKSRTEEAGGGGQMERVFMELMPRMVPLLEQRGLQPKRAMAEAIRQSFEEIDQIVQDIWHRKLAGAMKPWWSGPVKADHLFFAGLLHVAGSSRWPGRPGRRFRMHGDQGKVIIGPWPMFLLWLHTHNRRREIRVVVRRARPILLSWATIALATDPRPVKSVRVRSLDFRTIWVAQQLRLALGIEPLVDKSVSVVPDWLNWRRAEGGEPLLDCSDTVALTP